jgi:two-component system, OmpR family, alkaline phosphatase synthesis response regulator PhoP
MTEELILLVDDETNITDLARLYLEREGFKTIFARNGLEALDKIESEKPALVLLDVMLPGLDGFEVCRRLRFEKNDVPVIILTARDEDVDKIIGLELGADDYMTKPFNPRELVARVKAILRRAEPRNNSGEKASYHFGNLLIDMGAREVRVGQKLVILRRHEFELLKVLLENKGRVLTREDLLRIAWGFDFVGQTRTIDVHVAQLRNKLSQATVKIETVAGVGYKLVE